MLLNQGILIREENLGLLEALQHAHGPSESLLAYAS